MLRGIDVCKESLWNLYCASVIILWISANLWLFKRQAGNGIFDMFDSFHYYICVSNLYEYPDGFLGRYAYSNEEKIGSQESSTVIILYFETCCVASMVNPGGVVVITPD